MSSPQASSPTTHKCQCEHARHGDGCPGFSRQTIATDYGPFEVCDACRDCMPKKLADAHEPKGQTLADELRAGCYCGAALSDAPPAVGERCIPCRAAAALEAKDEALREIVGQAKPNSFGYDAASVALNDDWRNRARAALALGQEGRPS